MDDIRVANPLRIRAEVAPAGLAVPEIYRGVVVRADEVRMFDGLATRDKDPRKSLHLQEVPTPEVGPGRGARRGHGQRHQLQHRVDLDLRARVDVRVPRRYAQASELAAKHDQPFHVVGSDLAGVVLRVGPGVTTLASR